MVIRNTFSWQKTLQNFYLPDLLSANQHSADFRHSRASYIYTRIQVLIPILAILTLLWLPFEYFLLPTDKFSFFIVLRLGIALALLLLGWWQYKNYNLLSAYIRLLILIAIPSIFYITAICALYKNESILTGYDHFPFALIAMGAIFPLTLLEGSIIIFLILAIFMAAKLFFNHIIFTALLNDLWLLLLLASITLWSQLAQLNILLRLYRQATRDALTGLFNRRVVMEHLHNYLAIKRPITLLLFDLDRFKRINDSYGHMTGDAVLQEFALILKNKLPKGSIVGRYGGEEFLAVIPDVDINKGRLIAEMIKNACHQVEVKTSDNQIISFTTSIGVGQSKVQESQNDLLNRLDDGLYLAKQSGRDQVVSV